LRPGSIVEALFTRAVKALFIHAWRENHEVFSFVDESPDLLLLKRSRADPLTQETLLAQVMRISSL
jgi:hypothetical protein